MKVKELLTESLQKKDTYKILLDFIEFAAKDLELDSLPKFDFVFDGKASIDRKSFGGTSDAQLVATINFIESL